MKPMSGCASVLFGTLLVVASAAADDRKDVAIGTLCRITAPSVSESPLVGTLAETSDRGLILVGPEIGKRTIPFDAVTKLEWSAGRRSRMGAYAWRGALLGLLVGGIGGATSGGECEGSEGSCAAMGAMIGAVGWGATGALVGGFVKSYGWKEARLPHADVSVAPIIGPGSRAGIALALSW